MATLVYLSRHGQTEWNVERRLQGHADSDLTPHGWEQARQLADRLAAVPLAAIYSSDLGRARRTAEVVARPHGLPVRTHSGLCEIDTGRWTGLTFAELHERFPDQLDLYRRTPAAHHFPDGERLADVQARALAALGEILPRHDGASIAVVSHGAIVETILVSALGLPLTALWLPRHLPNAALNVLEWTDGTLRLVECYDPDLLRDSSFAVAPPAPDGVAPEGHG